MRIFQPVKTRFFSSAPGPGFGLPVAFVYIVIFPFYLAESGLPQISTVFIAAGFSLYFARMLGRPHGFRIPRPYFWAGMFAAYCLLINMIYFAFLPDKVFFLSSFYYVFNSLVFIFFAALIREKGEEAVTWIYAGVVIALIIQIAALHYDPGLAGQRATGTFNNPNQLAYWSWLCAAIVIVLRLGRKITLFDIAVFLCVGYIQTMSLSKAGLVCTALLALSLPLSGTLPRHYMVLFLGMMTAVLILASFNLPHIMERIEENENIARAISRIENIGHESDDNAQARGYRRIVENPHYLLVGAGEGGYERFYDTRRPLELHSGIGTILFSYGFMGLGLFLTMLYAVSYRNSPYILLLFGLLILFGLVHQNIRFTHFWVLLGVCEGMKYVRAGRRGS